MLFETEQDSTEMKVQPLPRQQRFRVLKAAEPQLSKLELERGTSSARRWEPSLPVQPYQSANADSKPSISGSTSREIHKEPASTTTILEKQLLNKQQVIRVFA